MNPNTWTEEELEILTRVAPGGSRAVSDALAEAGYDREPPGVQKKAARMGIALGRSRDEPCDPPEQREEQWTPGRGKWADFEVSSLGRLRRKEATGKLPAKYVLLPNVKSSTVTGVRYTVPGASNRVIDLLAEYWPDKAVDVDGKWLSWCRSRNRYDNARLDHRGAKMQTVATEPKVDDPDWFNLLGFKNLRVPDPAWGY